MTYDSSHDNNGGRRPGQPCACCSGTESACGETFLPHEPGTVSRDMNFREYSPVVDPSGLAHNATLLFRLARMYGLSQSVQEVVERLWKHLGRDQVVWGAKWLGTEFRSFEFYVYNREESRPLKLRSITGLREGISPLLAHVVPPDEACRYTMCSFDLDTRGLAMPPTGGMHLYVAGGNAKRRQESFSYGVSDGRLRLENHYTWYYADSEIDEILERLAWSAHAVNPSARQALLPAELCKCLTISYATKQSCDGLYFNRINTDQLLWFARKYLTAEVSDLIDSLRHQLAHVLWGVAFDFTFVNSDRCLPTLLGYGLSGAV